MNMNHALKYPYLSKISEYLHKPNTDLGISIPSIPKIDPIGWSTPSISSIKCSHYFAQSLEKINNSYLITIQKNIIGWDNTCEHESHPNWFSSDWMQVCPSSSLREFWICVYGSFVSMDNKLLIHRYPSFLSANALEILFKVNLFSFPLPTLTSVLLAFQVPIVMHHTLTSFSPVAMRFMDLIFAFQLRST